MLLIIPISIVNYFFTNPKVRLLFGLITGLILQFLMYGWGIYHLVLITFVTYLFNRYLNRKFSPFWILGLSVVYLSFLHIKRMIENWGGWDLDITGIYMVSVCKFSSLAFSFEDGGKSDDMIKSAHLKTK